MIRITELKLPLSAIPVAVRRAADAPSETDADRAPVAHPVEALTRLAAQALNIEPSDIGGLQVFKRSFDARKADLVVVYIVDIELAPALEERLLTQFAGHPHIGATPDMEYQLVTKAPAHLAERPVVVGFGPCGMFAALVLAQMGFKPIVLERGKTVRERTKDTWGLWRKKTLNPESNVQFGEGGAGTFSDGKLWSQIKDPRFLGRKLMHEFVQAGAPLKFCMRRTRTSAPSSWLRWWRASVRKSPHWAAKFALSSGWWMSCSNPIPTGTNSPGCRCSTCPAVKSTPCRQPR